MKECTSALDHNQSIARLNYYVKSILYFRPIICWKYMIYYDSNKHDKNYYEYKIHYTSIYLIFTNE